MITESIRAMSTKTFQRALRIPVKRQARRAVVVLPYAGDLSAAGLQVSLAGRLRTALRGLGLSDVSSTEAQELIRDSAQDYDVADVTYHQTERGTVNLTGTGWGHFNYPTKDILVF